MDLQNFIALEKQRIQKERQRLSSECAKQQQASATTKNNLNITTATMEPARGTDQISSSHNETLGSMPVSRSSLSAPQRPSKYSMVSATTTTPRASTALSNMQQQQQDMPHISQCSPMDKTFVFFTHSSPLDENSNGAVWKSGGHSTHRSCGESDFSTELVKEWVNQKEVHAKNLKENIDKEHADKSKKGARKKDDMDQWVSDTFYSYFPAYNNEYQKRQNLLRERQRDYEEQFLKHRMSHPPLTSKHAKIVAANAAGTNAASNVVRKSLNTDQQKQQHTARSSTSTISTSTASHVTDKTDLEIIVNDNPDYAPRRHLNTTRPETTRHRLLQDLKHTEFVGMSDGIAERNRHNVELEMARKKEYQRELMQQIEEKRRSIEILKEKERLQEEVLTRRLQDQLKTIRLEEQLEKEKMLADKIRFDAAQNRLMREHLLAKLEYDAKLLEDKEGQDLKQSKGKDIEGDNKVYKYFSNSARREYRRGRPGACAQDVDLNELDLDLANLPMQAEKECFHLIEKVCPMCDAPLKSYESCCLRCQKKFPLTIKVKANGQSLDKKKQKREADKKEEILDSKGTPSTIPLTSETKWLEGLKEAGSFKGESHLNGDSSSQDTQAEEPSGSTVSLVCVKCERLYTLCPTCLAQKDVCRACHRKKNVCMHCRRQLCSFCLEEIATGKDTERSHINDEESPVKKPSRDKNEANSEKSFHILNMQVSASKDNKATISNQAQTPQSPHPFANIHTEATPPNNHRAKAEPQRPSYSINIERNSIFHPDYAQNSSPDQYPKVYDKPLDFEMDISTDDSEHIERVRKETDMHLSRYLKNYGDLAQYRRSKSESRSLGTQTTSVTAGRRDVVLNEEHNLSMPLLREMPKMTRREQGSSFLEQEGLNVRRKIDNLKRRWEIPAVQKYTISNTSPRVLTQVGAIRKQLQVQRLMDDELLIVD